MATPPTFTSGAVLTAAQMNAVGLWKVGTFTANGTSRALVCDNVFTSDFTNYKIVVKLASTSNTNTLYFQTINTSGTTVTSGYFSASYGRDIATAGATTVTALNNTTVVQFGYVANGTANPTGAEFTIYGPRLTEWTTVTGQYTGVNSGAAYQAGSFYATINPSPNTMRGIRFDNSAGTNLTGVVSIYGYNL